MLDIAETETAGGPAILICAYDPGDDAWPLDDASSGPPWSPPGVRSITIPGGDSEGLATRLSERLAQRGCRALLLVGRTQRGDGFRVQMRAEHHRPEDGETGYGTGPSLARTTAPVADIVEALHAAGLAAGASSESDDDAGSYLMYRILTALPDGVDVPAVGLLRAPEGLPAELVRRGVKAAATAMAGRLGPISRPG